MADNRRVKKTIKDIQRIKTWQLLVLLLLTALLSATFLRLNNIGMIERRTAVIEADKQGDTQSIQTQLYALQRYVSSHMNADPGPIYLQEQYDRDSKQLVEANQKAHSKNTIFDKADKACKSKHPEWQSWSPEYVECFASELKKYPAGDNLEPAKLPDPSMYRYDYASPVWSADFAGWSLLVGVVIVLLIVVRVLSLIVLRLLLRRHYQSV